MTVVFESADRPVAPAISVLTTVYNRQKYLDESVRSVLQSTFDDFELLIVDDQSKDNSVEIAVRIAHTDPRIRVFRNNRNLGDYGNRNAAASLACGRYLKYVDSDDLLYRHSLAIMFEAMEAHPSAGLGLCHSLPEEEQPYPWELSPKEAYRKQLLDRGCMGCGPSGTILRRSFFEELGGFNPEWRVLADTEMWFRMSARFPMLLLPPGLVWWRRHDGQEFSSSSAEHQYVSRGFQLVRERILCSECPLTNEERSVAYRKAKRRFVRTLISIAVKKRQPFKALQMWQESGLGISALASIL